MATAQQALIGAADTTAENTAQSMGDRVQAPSAKITPTTDPSSFIQQSQGIQKAAFDSSGVAGAMQKFQQTGNDAVAALDFVAEKYKQDELKKLPLDQMLAERDRIMSAKFRVLPDILARTDIVDYKAKVNLANQLIGTYDAEISAIDRKREELEAKADSRAKLKVSEMQAKANILDKRSQNAKFALDTAMDLYKTGQGDLQSILESAVALQQDNEERLSSDNIFLGGEPVSGAGGFTAPMIAAFQYFEANNKFPVSSGISDQMQLKLATLYRQWVAMGKPGSRSTYTIQDTPPPGVSPEDFYYNYVGKPYDLPNPFLAPAESKSQKANDALSAFTQAIQQEIEAAE
jgi:hypothetical protein